MDSEMETKNLNDFEPDPSLLPEKGTFSRREFIQWMSALSAVLGTSACYKQPQEKILPYTKAPENLVLGIPLFYASATTLGGIATGILVENHEGRPTKIEGNPSHSASLGSTDVFGQAAILGLYDPDRSQAFSHQGKLTGTWVEFLSRLKDNLAKHAAVGGEGLRILTPTITSPTLGAELKKVLAKYPKAQWHQYEPVSRDNVREGAKLAFGSPVETRFRFDQANVVLSLDADFLFAMPGSVRYARDFMDRRRVRGEGASLMKNRLYMVQASPSITAATADNAVGVKPSEVATYARFLAAELGAPVAKPGVSPVHSEWLSKVAKDLKQNAGSSLILVGDHQPAWLHSMVHSLNALLGNEGKTVIYTDSVEANPINQMDSLRTLVSDMEAGRVGSLVILGGNPVYESPADLKFGNALANVKFRTHLGLYENETSKLCQWHIPEAHFLESWGDARAFDGTVTIQQPMIAPLYDGKSSYEVVAALLGDGPQTGYEIVQGYWKTQKGFTDFDKNWRRALHDGVVAGSELPVKSVKAAKFSVSDTSTLAGALEVAFRPDPSVWDGQFANNAWLQELPRPLTKLTWDNAIILGPKSAKKYNVGNEDLVEISADSRSVKGAVLVNPLQPEDCVTVHLGYGRPKGGRVAEGAGFNAYELRTSDGLWAKTISLRKLNKRHRLAVTHGHHSVEGRDIIRVANISTYAKDPYLGHAEHKEEGENVDTIENGYQAISPAPVPLPVNSANYQWGMSIDMNACIGCNACVIACQSENNIPSVGKEEVMRERDMHWIRIDTYFSETNTGTTRADFQPVPCMHCEKAPCEVVCPVNATNHTEEGLNAMVYNRCVGTKYCSNNCPYKVRRFNFLKYSDTETPVLRLMRNPDVSVRTLGVMEKCTYCIQRIQGAKYEAERQDRLVADGEIIPACAQACPTKAVAFGNISDSKSLVSLLKEEPRSYALLKDLGVRPRTTYLARLTNPNPEIEREG
jgi:Fe-S-cluster-containing dehydrogenase component